MRSALLRLLGPIVDGRLGGVGIVALNRPQAHNALSAALRNELLGAVEAFDDDAEVGCILITGSDKAFAAGADIKEMADKSYIDIFRDDYAADYERLARVRKPVIAAGAGVWPGGGRGPAPMWGLLLPPPQPQVRPPR